jgi:putative addiction module CopG family antidote
VNVTLTKQQTAYVQDKVKAGGYHSASEVIREALRVLEELETDRAAIDAALDEADLEPAIEVKKPKHWWKELRDELHREHAQRHKSAA